MTIKIFFFLHQYWQIDWLLSRYLISRSDQVFTVKQAISLYFFTKNNKFPENKQEKILAQIKPHLQEKMKGSSVITNDLLDLLCAAQDNNYERVLDIYKTNFSFQNQLPISKDKIQTQCALIHAWAVFENGDIYKAIKISRHINLFQLDSALKVASYHKLMVHTKQTRSVCTSLIYLQLRYPLSRMSILVMSNLMYGYKKLWLYCVAQILATLGVYWLPLQSSLIIIFLFGGLSIPAMIRPMSSSKNSNVQKVSLKAAIGIFLVTWSIPLSAVITKGLFN